MTQHQEHAIYDLLVDPDTGLGALNQRVRAMHKRIDGLVQHCHDTHAAADGAHSELHRRLAEIEHGKMVANGMARGRLQVILVLAKILALVGVGSGGVGALVAILKAAFGG